MSEQKELVDFQYQKANKPMIENVIPECLDGKMRESALDFVAWLRTNKIKPVWSAWQTWRANYKGNVICTIRLPYPPCKNLWGVTPLLNHINKYEEAIINEGLQNVILDNVTYCVYSSGQSGIGCNHKPCAGGESRTIFGKEIKYVCCDSPTNFMRLLNPDETTLDDIKKLLKFEQNAREENSGQEIMPLFKRNEESEKSLYKEYIPVDPKSKIEDVAAEFLEGEKLKNALDIIAWLRTNKVLIKPIVRESGVSWGCEYKGKGVCGISMGEQGFVTGSWRIGPIAGFNDESLLSDERLKEIVWANIKTCKNCANCGLGASRTIFGKKFENICGGSFGFNNPGAEEIECVKKLILTRIC